MRQMSDAPSTTRLQIYVVWHPRDSEGAPIAAAVLRQLHADPDRPAAERLGIPVWFRTSLADTDAPPTPIDRGDPDDQLLVIVIAGAALLSSPRWRAWVRRVADDIGENKQSRMVVAATSAAALGASDVFGHLSVLRLVGIQSEQAQRNVVVSALAATADLLSTRPDERVSVFLSHAKSDGASIAEQLEARLSRAKLGHFLDTHQIVEGSRFDERILQSIGRPRAALVAIITDQYAGREWCRLEALWAKQRDVPFVMLDAVETGQERSLPYTGNVPLVRLGADRDLAFDAVLIALLREVVRKSWFARLATRFAGDGLDVLVMSNPPELLTLLENLRSRRDDGVRMVIHPDPPLPPSELEILRKAVDGIDIVTPIELICKG
jgi:hypothetical protein